MTSGSWPFAGGHWLGSIHSREFYLTFHFNCHCADFKLNLPSIVPTRRRELFHAVAQWRYVQVQIYITLGYQVRTLGSTPRPVVPRQMWVENREIFGHAIQKFRCPVHKVDNREFSFRFPAQAHRPHLSRAVNDSHPRPFKMLYEMIGIVRLPFPSPRQLPPPYNR